MHVQAMWSYVEEMRSRIITRELDLATRNELGQVWSGLVSPVRVVIWLITDRRERKACNIIDQHLELEVAGHRPDGVDYN